MRVSPILAAMFATQFPSEVTPLPLEAMSIYNTVQEFLGTLRSILLEGAAAVEEGDPEGGQKIRDFEYNWLSLFGFYKGITPLISDFYFNLVEH